MRPTPSNTMLDVSLGRYEFKQGGVGVKFWELYHEIHEGDAALFRVRWGKINAKKPQTLVVDYQKAYHLLRKIRRQGYEPTDCSVVTWAEFERRHLIQLLEGVHVTQTTRRVM